MTKETETDLILNNIKLLDNDDCKIVITINNTDYSLTDFLYNFPTNEKDAPSIYSIQIVKSYTFLSLPATDKLSRLPDDGEEYINFDKALKYVNDYLLNELYHSGLYSPIFDVWPIRQTIYKIEDGNRVVLLTPFTSESKEAM
jgi:hypothetical protein